MAHKAVRACQYQRPRRLSRVPSMEIGVHSRLFLARYKGCTNARCILSRSYGHEEFRNVNTFSVQKAYKAVRASQYHRSQPCSIVSSMEIGVHSRLFLARYKCCTKARCILSRSNGHEEFKNVNPFSVQKAHKAVRASQYHRPCSEVLCLQWKFAYTRDSSYLGTKVALMQDAYYQEAMGMKSLKMLTVSRCKRRTKLCGPANITIPCCAV